MPTMCYETINLSAPWFSLFRFREKRAAFAEKALDKPGTAR